jgi:hypothetical protein
VRLVSVEPGSFWSFVYEHADGLDRITLSEEELSEIELFDVAATPAFDGDAKHFRLGLEARRIKTAITYEMAAVAVSNIRPLPHQLEAVYDEFLTQPRLWFLLADDPGQERRSWRGLYAKELVLRRSGDRILLVVPANLRPQWVRERDEARSPVGRLAELPRLPLLPPVPPQKSSRWGQSRERSLPRAQRQPRSRHPFGCSPPHVPSDSRRA